MKSVSSWMGRTAFVLAIGLAGPAWADAPVDEAAASALYEKGIALENAGEWAKAEVQFQESLKRHARPRAAAHLGRVQVEQGKFVEGATNIEWFFQEDTEIPLEAKKGARQPLDVAMKNVGILKLSIEPLDAKVFIDGLEIETKRRGWPQYVTPGVSHKVEVKKDGFVTKSEAWTVAAGTEKLVKITLEAAKVEVGDGKGQGSQDKRLVNGSKIYPGWFVGGGLTVLGIATFVGGARLYSNSDPEFHRLDGLIKAEKCDSDCKIDIAEYNLDNSATRALAYTGVALGAAGVGVLVYSAITTKMKLYPHQEGRHSLRIVPGVGSVLIMGQM